MNSSHVPSAVSPMASAPEGYMAIPGGGYVDMHQFTQWENPTDRDVVLELHKETPKHGRPIAERVPPNLVGEAAKLRAWEEQTGKRRFVIRAKGSAFIPSEYDRAIQDVRDGQIVGGFGPQLINAGAEERPILSPALDAAYAKNRELLDMAQKALHEKVAAEQALALAQGQLVEQEKRLAMSRAADAATAGAQGANPNNNSKKDK